MLCLFGQLRKSSVASHFIHFSSSATSSVTNEYVTVPEHNGQNEEPASKKKKRAGDQPSSAPKMYLEQPQNECIHIWAC